MSNEITCEVSSEGIGGTLPMVEYSTYNPGESGLGNKQLIIDARDDRVFLYAEEYNYDTSRRKVVSLTLPRDIWDQLKSLVAQQGGSL